MATSLTTGAGAAQAPVPVGHDEFEQLTGPLRPELLAHCYRLLGSVTEAEDQVQETYLRAWRGFHSFEGRASVRTWMYRIATNTCLTARERDSRRPLPSGLGAPAGDPTEPVVADQSRDWLEPLPDAVVWGGPAPDPAVESVAREGVGLAFAAALQHLPARQRAALVLRDVLDFSAAETAEALDCSTAAANSALQRARATVRGLDLSPALTASALDERSRQTYAAFMAAFERYDIPAVVEVLSADAVWEMPPFTRWYGGAPDIGALVGSQCPADGPGALRMVPTVVNGQPAAGMYLRRPGGEGHDAFQLVVLDIVDGEITHVVGFFDTAMFGLAGLSATV
ncbi:sigma-70 family RNA polymerase sigma factor [Actinomycetota bacterium]